jgi:glutamate/tyrosine decarboxylase-like PLP-dependent enzyme
MAVSDERIGPGDLSPGELRRVGGRVVEAIAEYHEGLDRRAVMPDVTPAEVAERFAGAFPSEGEPAEALIEDWRARVAPLLTAIGSPRQFAYVLGSGATVGMFADTLAACTNSSAGAWRMGPAAVAIEAQCLRWIAGFVGYPEDSGGLLVSGGTMANFTAILTALRHVAPYDSTPDGLQDGARSGRFLVYMSDHEGHVAVTRAADMLNLGRRAVRVVPSRPDLTMDPVALDRMLEEDRRRGDLPFCVVAQLGSVNVGAIDPIGALADVCERHGVWLHGDGACGLLAAGLAEKREAFAGLERADSVCTDAHKWLGVPYDCGVLLVRRGERLRRAFSIAAPYLGEGPRDEHGLDYLEYGPQMSRAFRALKVWMVLRSLGADGLRDALSRSLRLARHLHGLVGEHPDFEVLHEPSLYIYSFRFVPNALAAGPRSEELEQRLDRLNEEIAEAVTRSGLALLMTTRIRGRVALRMSICSHRTRERDVDATFEALAGTGRRLAAHAALGETCRVA